MPQVEQGTLWQEPSGDCTPLVEFRPIHYLGSKLRLLEEIRCAIDDVDEGGGVVCDLFAGSGTVSLALSGSRRVTSVDIQEYSRVLCSALLSPEPTPVSVFERFLNVSDSELFQSLCAAVHPLVQYESECIEEAVAGRPDALSELLDGGSILSFSVRSFPKPVSTPLRRAMEAVATNLDRKGLRGLESLITRFYGGVYFSYAQAAHLDAMLAAADSAPRLHRDSLLAMTLSTASDIVNTVGKHFAQPIRLRKRDGQLKTHLISKVRRDRQLDAGSVSRRWADRYAALPHPKHQHRVVRADYLEYLQSSEPVGVVYADPPYTRDHYSRYYHVLETMARRDLPSVSTSNLQSLTLSRGLYRTDRYQSPFCVKTQAPRAFTGLFEECNRRKVPLVLSYSPYDSGAHPRLMTIDQITSLAKTFFATVERRSVGAFAHSKLNSSDRALTASAEGELLLLCRHL
jgi:adenine-specific DNA-methyltransferase